MNSESDGMVRIGISGWTYKAWQGVFYPAALRTVDHLKFASRIFSTIELNGSFYSLQRPSSYRAWHDATPDGFVFAIKGGRYITHYTRLRNAEQALANFFASGVLELRDKLGPILWQLPPNFVFDSGRLQDFFELLPRTHVQAAELAKKHSTWMGERVAFGDGGVNRIRYAVEFRHPSFVDPEFVNLLRRYAIAPCVADSAGHFPTIEDLCSDFVYVRLHGSEQLYTSGYSEIELRQWASRSRRWRAGLAAPRPRHAHPSSIGDARRRDVYVYFDNDTKVYAPFDAVNLDRILGGQKALVGPLAERSLPGASAASETSTTVRQNRSSTAGRTRAR